MEIIREFIEKIQSLLLMSEHPRSLLNSLHPELFSQIRSVSPDLISQNLVGDVNQIAVIMLIFIVFFINLGIIAETDVNPFM